MVDDPPPSGRFVVGQAFRERRGPVTTTQLVKYAGASGDFHRIHYDQAFAAETGIGTLLVHGMLTLGFVAACLTDALGPDIRADELSARFTEPVRVGEIVDCIATVTSVRADGSAELELRAAVEDRVVLKGRGLVRICARRPTTQPLD